MTLTEQRGAARRRHPEKLRRLLRGDLDTIVAKALKKSAPERYPSVTALADDLRRYLAHQPIGARPDTLAYRTTKFVQASRARRGGRRRRGRAHRRAGRLLHRAASPPNAIARTSKPRSPRR